MTEAIDRRDERATVEWHDEAAISGCDLSGDRHAGASPLDHRFHFLIVTVVP
ncbi:MAG TPA: hypothetical protein VLB44_17225 [Kofleriaceae bacterium]|nr:hypothetical protein [Kofleriaceae bacterium]